MTFQVFKTIIINALEGIYPEASIDVIPVKKNNNSTLSGLVIKKKDVNIAPTIYLDYYYGCYNRGASIDEITKRIVNIYEKNAVAKSLDFDFMCNFDAIKDNVIYKLVNREKNKELLETVPYVEFLDLAIVFYYVIDLSLITDASSGVILLTNDMTDYWGISALELLDVANKNTPKLCGLKIRNMFEYICSISNIPFEDDPLFAQAIQNPVYILTNDMMQHGATVMIYENTLNMLASKLKTDFYILPSSIHEVLVFPVNDADYEEIERFKSMVLMVNDEHVPSEEVLSNSVYYYDRNNGRLMIAA
ncbi:MAG: hypothetical protein HUJ70_08240 [Pseudobutyrivibrio sp.]|nr:hypothetical protein [Pseudobutyrivibrio sp.]